MYGNAVQSRGVGHGSRFVLLYIQHKMRFFDPRAWVEGAKAQCYVPNLQWFGAAAGPKDDVLANAIR